MDIRFLSITGFSFFLLIIITIRGLESHFSNFVLHVSSSAMDACFLNITCVSFFSDYNNYLGFERFAD